MSGICGAWRFDGQAPDLAPVLAALERRGPDATNDWRAGWVALGHTLLATTPEALVEKLPLEDKDSGCVITADVRLDNREELIGALALATERRTIGDGELILRAYLKWGEQCPTHLLGDFAFAIWDPRAPRLFCARDHMGMRQLIYHHDRGSLFAFATEAESLIALAAVPKRINEARIADFLDELEAIDFTSTFFAEVYRLPPAHWLSVDGDGLAIRRYWTLTAGPELRLDSDQAYVDRFLPVFDAAVRCRLRSAGQVGSMLSGGIDSSSIAAVASRHLAETGGSPLRTYSAIDRENHNCPETRAIGAMLDQPGILATTVDRHGLGGRPEQLMRLIDETGEPFDEHMTLIRAIYLAARDDGVRVVLDGVAGDVVLASVNRVADHLRNKRFEQAWREARDEQLFWKIPRYRWRSLVAGAQAAFLPSSIRRAKRWLRCRWADARIGRDQRIDRRFAERTGLAARRAMLRGQSIAHDILALERRIEAISRPYLTVARERYDRTAGAIGVEPRDPFMDIRLIQFCLSLPIDLLQRDGWPKTILRLASAGLVPEAVRWRRGKEHLGWAFTQSLFQRFPAWRMALDQARPLIARYTGDYSADPALNENTLERQFGRYVLARWLARNRPSNR